MSASPLRVLITEIGNFATGDEALYLAAAHRIIGFGHDVTFLHRVDQSRALAAAGLSVRQIPFQLLYQGAHPRSLDALVDGFQRDEPAAFRALSRIVREHDVVAIAPGGRFVDGYRNFRTMLTAALALRLGRPVIQLHQSFGPVSDEHERSCLRELLSRSRLVLVRDVRSMEFLRAIGVDGARVHEVRDAVFAETYPCQRRTRYRVGLNLRTGFNGHVTPEGVDACLRVLVREVPASDILVFSTTFRVADDVAAVAARYGCAVEPDLAVYPDYLALPAACDVIATDSFHGFIFSLLARTPVIAGQPDFHSWKLQGTTCPGQPAEPVFPGARTDEEGRALAGGVLDVIGHSAPVLARQEALCEFARSRAEAGWELVRQTLMEMPARRCGWWNNLCERLIDRF